MQGKPYQTVVAEILNDKRPQAILDAPSGNGWLRSRLEYRADINGVDLFERGTHMHIMPWSFPQLVLYLKLNGFSEISIHDVPEKKPKHLFEKMLGMPQHLYCSSKLKRAITEEERMFWRGAGSKQSIYGRQLVVSAIYRK